MNQIMDNMDVILYLFENAITGLLTANIFLLMVVNKKGNERYKYHLFFYNLITMAGLCALILVQHKPYPTYEFSDWKSPLFFFGLAAVTCVLCTSFIGIRYNIIPLTIIPICSIAIIAAEYFLRPYTDSPRKLYMTEFNSIYERAGIAMLIVALFVLLLRFKLYQNKAITQLYAASMLFGLSFASESAKDLIGTYLPMLIAADLILSLVHALYQHRSRIHLVKRRSRKSLPHHHARHAHVGSAVPPAKSHSPKSNTQSFPYPPKAVGSSDSITSLSHDQSTDDPSSNVISLAAIRKSH